ncbi:MAG: YcjF family protein [Chthoniobacterales bacterium]
MPSSSRMNQPLFLHIVERLEGFLHKLPASIQKPILHELTPLKELFLKERPPRLVLTGSHKSPVQEVFGALFAAAQAGDLRDVLMEVFRWQDVSVGGFGTITLLDARGADDEATRKIREELEREPADMFLHIVDGNAGRPVLSRDIENLEAVCGLNSRETIPAKVIGVSLVQPTRSSAYDGNGKSSVSEKPNAEAKLQTALAGSPVIKNRLLRTVEIPMPRAGDASGEISPAAARFMSLLAQELPNEARIEMIRISRDREAQVQIAQTLVKSTAAICTAIGAQPIPLADLPILTTLQLVMVSGIMYISGRERTLRAATEFVGALGVNVGAGMMLREGARAVLKFFPGWGNVVCGMVAGAGTYALGRAAIVYFLEGFTLKEARRIYLSSRKKRPQPKLLESRSARTSESAER